MKIFQKNIIIICYNFLNDIKHGKNLKSKFINSKNYLFELLENIDDSYKKKIN